MDAVMVIAALKVAGALLGGVLGVTGVLFNFKRADNRISGWGVLVLVGIVLSATAGVVGSIAEGYKARSESSLQATRTEALLKELSRAIQPITELEITYWATLPPDTPQIRAYSERVSKTLEAEKKRLPHVIRLADNKSIHVTASDVNDEPLTVDLGLRSALWPRANEPPVGDVALDFRLNVFIRRSPMASEDFWPVIGVGYGDASADWVAMGLPVDLKNRNHLEFDRRTQRLTIFGRAEYSKTFWVSNGAITSIVDLYGAQLMLIPANAWDVKLPERYAQFDRPKIAELTRLLELKTVALRFREGRELWISGKSFQKTKFKGGYPVFSIVLPPDDAGFQKVLPKD